MLVVCGAIARGNPLAGADSLSIRLALYSVPARLWPRVARFCVLHPPSRGTMADSASTRRDSQRREAWLTAYRMLPDIDALREILRRIKEPGRALPSLAGSHLGRAAILRLVRAVSVELILEHTRSMADCRIECEADSLLAVLDRWKHAPSSSAAARGWQTPIEPDPSMQAGGIGSESRSPRVGSVVVVLHARDTPESYLHCGDGIQKHLFRVVHIHADNSAEVAEEDYATYAAAVAAHPGAAIRPASGPPAVGA